MKRLHELCENSLWRKGKQKLIWVENSKKISKSSTDFIIFIMRLKDKF